ncbi:MAG: TonB-dependent receptor [Endozoicomonas sp.]
MRAETPKFRRQLLPVAIALCAAQMSSAQAEEASQSNTLEEVIVTAQKRAQSVQDIAGSVSAVTADSLEKSNTSNFSDLGKISAGVEVAGNDDGFNNSVRIRGVGNNSFTPSIRPSVGIFVDDVPLIRTEAAFNNLMDVDRIEILKGPQSTLFGKEVSGGAISLHTKKPHTEEIEGSLEANVGNRGLFETRGVVNLPVSDVMAVRVSAYDMNKEGFITNIVTDKKQSFNGQGGRLSALWEINDNWQADISYETHKSKTRNAVSEKLAYGDLSEGLAQLEGKTLLGADPYDGKIQVGSPGSRDSETEIWSLHIDGDLNDTWSFSSVTGYQDFSATNGGDGPNGSADGVMGSSDILLFINKPLAKGLSQEVRFTFENEKFSSILGAFYADTESKSTNDLLQTVGIRPVTTPGGTIMVPVKSAQQTVIDSKITDWALFNHNTYQYSDDIELTFGARYSSSKREELNYRKSGAGVFGGMHQGAASTWDEMEQNKTYNAVTGTLKVSYFINPDVMVYAGYDRGFKSGGFNTIKDNLVTQADGSDYTLADDFDSEYSNNFEVGFKADLLESTLRWNTSLFYQTFKNYQVEIPDGVAGNTIQSDASVVAKGVETELVWLATDALTIDANIAYIDSRFDEYENATCMRPQYAAVTCVGGSQDLSGERINATSPLTANLNATYSGLLDGGMGWFVRGEAAYKGERTDFPDLDPVSEQKAYTLYNASIGFTSADGSWQATLWGKNLTDKEYISQYSRSRDATLFPVPNRAEGVTAAIGDPRSYGLTVKYNF